VRRIRYDAFEQVTPLGAVTVVAELDMAVRAAVGGLGIAYTIEASQTWYYCSDPTLLPLRNAVQYRLAGGLSQLTGFRRRPRVQEWFGGTTTQGSWRRLRCAQALVAALADRCARRAR